MICVVLYLEFYGFYGEYYIFCYWWIIEWIVFCKFIEEIKIYLNKKCYKCENKVKVIVFFIVGYDVVFKVVNLNRY